MELGYHLSTHQCQKGLALSLVGDRRVEPQGRGLGCCGTRRHAQCGRYGLPGLPVQADKQVPPAAASSPCRPAMPSRRLLEELRAATLEVRLGGLGLLGRSQGPGCRMTAPTPNYSSSRQSTARLPEQPIQQQRPYWPMGRRVRRLVQPTAQWNQICDASTAP